MGAVKQKINDIIKVIDLDAGYPTIQIRTVIITEEDGGLLSKSFHRKSLLPTDDISKEDSEVVAVAETVFTDKAKQKYKEFLSSQSLMPYGE